MNNIWDFLIQTLTVSLVAGILLVVKKLLEDKLSPRWQYSVWIILALRILIPVNTSHNLIIPLPVWTEVLKTKIESILDSTYSMAYKPIDVTYIFPNIQVPPKSISDWLFIIYVAGIIVCLCKYFVTYIHLRLLLREGKTPSQSMKEKIQYVSEKYGLKICRVIEVSGLTSAFVCGGFSPVLAIPENTDIDEKILLHELLHYKYHDTLQNIGWCILRSFHWCNPFLHFVFNRIGNEMESLCDQRVLERIEGEERRSYGIILLDMANERYARVPGTSSISNGGKNISMRISSIVRFKKYPKDMALVSICILFVLASPTILGMTNTYTASQFKPQGILELENTMAMTRLNRCSTVAGALNTYAKGLMLENGIYIAASSSIEKQEVLFSQMMDNWKESRGFSYLDSGIELEFVDKTAGFYVFNMRKQSDEVYSAILSFHVQGFIKEYTSDGGYVTIKKDGETVTGCVQIPVEICKENGWIVKETGKRKCVYEEPLIAIRNLPPVKKYEAIGESGTFILSMYTRYHVNTSISDTAMGGFFSSTYLDETPMLDAQFDYGYRDYWSEYTLDGKKLTGKPEHYVGTMINIEHPSNEDLEFPEESMVGNVSGSRGNGFGCFVWSVKCIDEDWNGIHRNDGGGNCELKNGEIPVPEVCKVQIFWDGKLVEEMTAREVTP